VLASWIPYAFPYESPIMGSVAMLMRAMLGPGSSVCEWCNRGQQSNTMNRVWALCYRQPAFLVVP